VVVRKQSVADLIVVRQQWCEQLVVDDLIVVLQLWCC